MITVHDRAGEYRIAIKGRFGAEQALDVEAAWKHMLSEHVHRRFTVDISELTGYDTSARKLLRAMYHHGVTFAASTPASLVFLNEISSLRKRNVTAMPEASREASSKMEAKSSVREESKPVAASRAAWAGK